MQTKLNEIEKSGANVMAVSANTSEEIREHLLPKGITFTLLADPQIEAIDAYGLRHEGGNPMTGGDIARPAIFLIDENGIVVEAMLTENWRVRPTGEMILEKLK